jgi:hypothetical protein
LTDTPKHIKDIQLKLWLTKTPEERLFQFITENDAWWKAINEAKANKKKQNRNTKNTSG